MPLGAAGAAHLDAPFGGGEAPAGRFAGQGVEGQGGQGGEGEAQAEAEGAQGEGLRQSGEGLHCGRTGAKGGVWQIAGFAGDINCKRM